MGNQTLLIWLPVKSHQTNSHLGQVTPFLVKSPYIHVYEIKKDYSEGGLGYLAPIVGQLI